MRHDKNRSGPWPRATALAVTAGIALLTAACGGGGTSAGAGASPSATSTYAKEVAYAQCMRSHGVPSYPDPDSNGAFNASGINLHSAQVQSAQKACQSLAPNVGQSGQSQAQNAAQALKYAQCMRSHALPTFPDPGSNGSFHFSIKSGINPQSATYQKAQQACQSMDPGLPQAGG
jgi:hypothetical protein